MPTQSDFEAAARDLRGTLVDLTTSRRHLTAARESETIAGGTIAPVVDAALEVSAANVDRLAGLITALAMVCDRRSRVCAEHAAAIARWEARYAGWEQDMLRYRTSFDDPLTTVPSPGSAPNRPTAPHSWVEPA